MTPARKIAAGDVAQRRERPIIFSAPMVRALLAGRKTQTRRVLKPQPKRHLRPWQDDDGSWMQSGYGEIGDDLLAVPFVIGDRLWVRETWQAPSKPAQKFGLVYYDADRRFFLNHEFRLGKNVSPIHMPRWASCLTLAVTDVRVQRLQEISEADARAEGVHHDTDGWRDYEAPGTQCCATAVNSYRTLWNSIHGPAAWDANPWVAAISFTVDPAPGVEVREIAP